MAVLESAILIMNFIVVDDKMNEKRTSNVSYKKHRKKWEEEKKSTKGRHKRKGKTKRKNKKRGIYSLV